MNLHTHRLEASHADLTNERLERVLHAHFDPQGGTAYWLERQAALGVDVRREVRCIQDLKLLGDMKPSDLADRPLLDFIPRKFHKDLSGFVVGQTGGTTGGGVWTAYRPDEFEAAFITPFEVAARHVGFPTGQQWLFVGPSGPHIIGKVLRDLSASMGSHDPFSVDFDARWAKKLPDGSFAMERYLGHVVEQALRVIEQQEIGVLFTTPAVLTTLAEAMSPAQRSMIRGIHYGGMEVNPQLLSTLQREMFPEAVHLCGYGNTLFGCTLELDVECGRIPRYFPFGTRLLLEVVNPADQNAALPGLGVVRFTRLDESCLIVRMLERDAASPTDVPEGAPSGFMHAGVENPHSPVSLAPRQAKGLY
ncbi:MAG: hypothetical protein NTV94_04390 [Planctomycetota bacterium]|nr:hypothetical protein [Planctomycetota bacterium]